MRIDPNELYGCFPMVKIRHLLKIGQLYNLCIGNVQEKLQTKKSKAIEIIRQLECDGYIEKNKKSNKIQFYSNTIKGNALALASAAKPLKRATGERLIKELLERVEKVNSEEAYLYKVLRVLLFGSMLCDKAEVSDVDLYIELIPKYEDGKKMIKLNNQKVKEQLKNGKTFSSFFSELTWSYEEVYKYLKSRSSGLSIHRQDDEIIDQVEYKSIFELNK